MHDSRSSIAERRTPLVTGATINFERDNIHYYVATGSATAISCPAWTTLPVGLQFILDNSVGTGTLTVTPTAGSAITVTTTKVFHCVVAANGTVKSSDLTA
jgi:hypothetical protein